MTALRTLAFGDDSVWGASWSSDSSSPALTALGDGPQSMSMPGVGLIGDGSDASRDWRLEAADVALTASPTGELVDVRAAEDGFEGWDQLCRVTGRFGQHEVDCLGLRTSWADGVDLTRFASIRSVSVWFDPAEAFALTAFRPRKAKHHDDDLLAAAVIAAEGAPVVEDPRLSTTYGPDGWPSRAGLELWLAGSEPEQQYPRRASGEAVGARALIAAGELELMAEPFRWHSRTREGIGMYLLARRR